MKGDVIDGSVVNGIQEPILFSFLLDEPAGYKVFCETETVHYKKLVKSVFSTRTFYLEHDNHEEVDFNGKTSNLNLHIIKI